MIFRTKPSCQWPPAAASPDREPPFVVELRQDTVGHGAFVPRAEVRLSAGFRSCGLLREVAGEELRLLLAVLSCLTPNGGFCATPELVASALGLLRVQSAARLERLARKRWQGEPLLIPHGTGGPLRQFSPSPHLFSVRQSPGDTGDPSCHSGFFLDRSLKSAPAGRERAIAMSRERYARPRAEVEAQINEFLTTAGRGPVASNTSGVVADAHATPESAALRSLALRLMRAGLTSEQTEMLLASYPMERVERQLDWLPYRAARNPAAYLIGAVERNYHKPSAVQVPNEEVAASESEGRP